MLFRRSDREKLDRILLAQRSILTAIATLQKVILAAIAEQCGDNTKAAKLAISLGKPAEKPDQLKE